MTPRSEALEWVDVADLLRSTEARNVSVSGNEFSFSCHGGSHAHGDAAPSAGMNARTTHWRCRSAACGLQGNAEDYLMSLKGLTRTEAARVLSERYGGPGISVEPGALEQEVARIRAERDVVEEPRVMISEDDYYARFAIRWPEFTDDLPAPLAYMLGRGFQPTTLNAWGLGYDDLSGRITIPVFDAEHKLVGIKGRAWDDRHPKYISIGDAPGRDPRYGFDTYQKSQFVYGIDAMRSERFVVLVEGELNVLALWQMGIPAFAAAGSDFSDDQAMLIASRFSGVTVYFDGDQAGAKGTMRVVEKLTPYVPVLIVPGAIYDAADALDPEKEFDVDDVEELIAGAQTWLTLQHWLSTDSLS